MLPTNLVVERLQKSHHVNIHSLLLDIQVFFSL